MEFGIGCCCGGTTFQWQRHCRRVGIVTANAALSDHTGEWELDVTNQQYVGVLQTFSTLVKMQPMRYEIGPSLISGAWGLNAWPGRSQTIAALRTTSPPTSGHVRRSKITAVTIPLFTYGMDTSGSSGGFTPSGSYVVAIELFKNGVSVGLYQFSRVSLNSEFAPFIIGEPVTLSLDETWIPSDTWSFDLYTESYRGNHPSTPPFGIIRAGVGSGYFSGQYIAFQSAVTRVSHKSIDGYQFRFASNGPGGITTLAMKEQPGWTYTEINAGSFSMSNVAGTHQIDFVWNVEIPYIRFIDFSKFNSPSGTHWEMRYRPNDSGDYVSFRDYPNNAVDITLGRWNPNSATVFGNLWRNSNGAGYWLWGGAHPSFTTGFPSAITVERI